MTLLRIPPRAGDFRPRRGEGRRAELSTLSKLALIYPDNTLGLWALADSSLAQARDASKKANHGVYSSAGVTLNQPGVDLGTCALFDGSSGYLDLSASAVKSQMNNDRGTLALCGKVSALGVWSDGAFRDLFRTNRDANNAFEIGRTNVANTLQFSRVAQAVNKTITTTLLGGSKVWFDLIMRWDLTADYLDAFVNGRSAGAPLTGIGAFVSGAHSSVFIGAQSSGSRPWSGFINYGQLWDVPLPVHDVEAWSAAVNPR